MGDGNNDTNSQLRETVSVKFDKLIERRIFNMLNSQMVARESRGST